MNIGLTFYAITTTISVILTALTLQRLLSGWWRHYYLLGLFLILGFATIVPPIASLVSNGAWRLSGVQTHYWILALAAQAFMYLLVLQLIFRALRETTTRSTLLRFLTLSSILVAAISIAIHFNNRPNQFMASVARDLTFLAALLNMVLWRLLMKVRKRDFLLLAVSAGVGIQCTGDAIGHSLRLLAKQVGSVEQMYEFGNIVTSLSAVMTIAIWHTAFSRSKYRADQKAGAQNSTDPTDGVASSRTHPAG